MNKEIVATIDSDELLPSGLIISEFSLDSARLEKIGSLVIKNNALVDMEFFKIDDKPLYALDMHVLSTAFIMAQLLKDNKKSFDANTKFTIPFDSFCKLWQIDWTPGSKNNSNLYRDIVLSIKRLNDKKFVYPNVDKNKMVESGYFAYIEYDSGVVSFGFPSPIIEYIQKDVEFTWYHLDSLVRLRRTKKHKIIYYSTSLFEQLQKYKFNSQNTKDGYVKVTFKSKALKKLFGISDDNYDRHIDFRRKVLDKIIEHFDTCLGLELKINNIQENELANSPVTGYEFCVRLDKKDMDFKLALFKDKINEPLMSVNQRRKFAKVLLSDPLFVSIYIADGELGPDTLAQLESDLADNKFLIRHHPHITNAGYSSKKFDNFISMFSIVGEDFFDDKLPDRIIEGECSDLSDDVIPF